MSEDKKFKEVLDKAKELETTKFNDESDFNIDEYFSVLEKIGKKNNNAKNDEAEFIVEEDATSMIDPEFIAELDAKRNSVESFIRKYDPNKEITKELELKDVDRVYAISNYLLNAYIQYVNEMDFLFVLTRDETKFLNKVLVNDIDYNGDEVFNFTELFNNFWVTAQQKLVEEKDADAYTFKVSIKSILLLHHLIKGHTVKGRNKSDFNNFSNILFKIAKVNKLFNAYNIIIERIKTDRELWGAGLDEVAKLKDPEYLAQMQAHAQEAEIAYVGQGDGVKVMEVTDADLGTQQ